MHAHHIGPEWDAMRHAQLMAALHNGPLVKPDKRPFTAADFLPPNPWATQADEPPEHEVASAHEFMALIKAVGSGAEA